jgi:glycosyltransferase involved in cell wall biosynthesis
LWELSPRAASDVADRVAKSLRGFAYDVVFAPDTIPVAYLDDERPVVTWTDATFASILGFYPGFGPETIAAESIRDGISLDRRAISRSDLSIYGSDWAARSAIDDLDADESRIAVVPFGANTPRDPSEDEVTAAVDRRDATTCKLLFLGSDWERKGGPLAIEVAAGLNAGGRPAVLTIVGCTPAIPEHHRRFVDVVGFLDKDGADAARFESILAASHFLILPTRAECFGLPFCEASAFGVPSLAANVGGVSTPVRDGVNGALFDPGATAGDYVSFIDRLLSSGGYRTLAVDAYGEYRRRLNWRTSAASVTSLLGDL